MEKYKERLKRKGKGSMIVNNNNEILRNLLFQSQLLISLWLVPFPLFWTWTITNRQFTWPITNWQCTRTNANGQFTWNTSSRLFWAWKEIQIWNFSNGDGLNGWYMFPHLTFLIEGRHNKCNFCLIPISSHRNCNQGWYMFNDCWTSINAFRFGRSDCTKSTIFRLYCLI